MAPARPDRAARPRARGGGAHRAAAAGDRSRPAPGCHDTKSSATDLVTEVDRAVEAELVQGLLAARPDDGVLGEEGAARPTRSGVRLGDRPDRRHHQLRLRLPRLQRLGRGRGRRRDGRRRGRRRAARRGVRGRARLRARPATAGPIRCNDADRPGHRPGRRPASATPAEQRARQAAAAHHGAARRARHPAGRRGRGRPVLGGLRPGRRLLRGGPEALGPRGRRPRRRGGRRHGGRASPARTARPTLTVAAPPGLFERAARAWSRAACRLAERCRDRYREQPWEPAS